MRRIALATALLLMLCAPLGAAAAPPRMGQYVDLEPVGMPVVVHGELVNYVFVYVRLNLSGGADVSRLRDEEPYFRDALVRMGHRTPFIVAGDYQRIDEARLDAAMLRVAQAIAGPGAVTSVVVTSQQPQKRVAPPRS